MLFVLCIPEPTAASLTLQALIHPRQGLVIAASLHVGAAASWASRPVVIEPAIHVVWDERTQLQINLLKETYVLFIISDHLLNGTYITIENPHPKALGGGGLPTKSEEFS